MGLFNKRQQPRQPSLAEVVGGDPQEQHDKLHSTFMEFIDEGLSASTLDSPNLRSELAAALSALIWEGFYSQDVDLLRHLQRVCAAYTVDVNEDLTVDQWGQWLFDDVNVTLHFRNQLTAQGKDGLERQLSLLATTQGRLLELSPKFEPVIRAIQAAAKTYLDSESS